MTAQEFLIAVRTQLVADARIGECPRVPSFGELRGDNSPTEVSNTFHHFFNSACVADENDAFAAAAAITTELRSAV